MSTGKEQETPPLPRPFGQYTLLKLLARGGMGEIFLARTTGLAEFEKYYAVKKLLAKYARDPDVTLRFVDEAKLGARLGHPNIVQVYDLGRINDELYMATEFVDGFDLRRILRFCHEKSRRIPVDIALFIVRELLSGLAYAHRQVDAQGRPINLVHRDISPQNVLVSFEGEVKIIDFGLAKSTQRSQETQAHVLLGNFGYMSPEQARGKRLDLRTDIYSTGIVLFELVTGTKRFMDDNPLLLLEKVATPAPVAPSERAPGIPRDVDRICARATNPNHEERYADAAEFRDDLTRVLFGINPRASREHLAEFLNYLFLGGPAPRTASLPSPTASTPSDIQDRTERLTRSGHEDDAPQTDPHAEMREAHVGDIVAVEHLLVVTVPEQTPATGHTPTLPSSASLPTPIPGSMPAVGPGVGPQPSPSTGSALAPSGESTPADWETLDSAEVITDSGVTVSVDGPEEPVELDSSPGNQAPVQEDRHTIPTSPGMPAWNPGGASASPTRQPVSPAPAPAGRSPSTARLPPTPPPAGANAGPAPFPSPGSGPRVPPPPPPAPAQVPQGRGSGAQPPRVSTGGRMPQVPADPPAEGPVLEAVKISRWSVTAPPSKRSGSDQTTEFPRPSSHPDGVIIDIEDASQPEAMESRGSHAEQPPPLKPSGRAPSANPTGGFAAVPPVPPRPAAPPAGASASWPQPRAQVAPTVLAADLVNSIPPTPVRPAMQPTQQQRASPPPAPGPTPPRTPSKPPYSAGRKEGG